MWQRVAATEELKPGTALARELEGRRLALGRTRDGSLFAMRDVCPHRGAPLSAGALVHPVTSAGFEHYELDTASMRLRCPWHGYEFDLDDGSVPTVPGMRVRCYAVRESDGSIEVELPQTERHQDKRRTT